MYEITNKLNGMEKFIMRSQEINVEINKLSKPVKSKCEFSESDTKGVIVINFTKDYEHMIFDGVSARAVFDVGQVITTKVEIVNNQVVVTLTKEVLVERKHKFEIILENEQSRLCSPKIIYDVANSLEDDVVENNDDSVGYFFSFG